MYRLVMLLCVCVHKDLIRLLAFFIWAMSGFSCVTGLFKQTCLIEFSDTTVVIVGI